MGSTAQGLEFEPLFSIHIPKLLWDPPTLPSNGIGSSFSGGKGDKNVKLSTHLQLVPKSRIR
jgi:hypothetical protein